MRPNVPLSRTGFTSSFDIDMLLLCASFLYSLAIFNIEGNAKRSSRRLMQTNWRPSALPAMPPSANLNTKRLTGALTHNKVPNLLNELEHQSLLLFNLGNSAPQSPTLNAE